MSPVSRFNFMSYFALLKKIDEFPSEKLRNHQYLQYIEEVCDSVICHNLFSRQQETFTDDLDKAYEPACKILKKLYPAAV
jgi:hypothetical protein